MGKTFAVYRTYTFDLIVPLQEVVNNHEGLAKRFSMNYMDTVGNGKGLDKRFSRNFFNPSDLKRSGKYYLEESNFLKTKLPTPIKRFSMNFLDTLDNPQVVNLGSNTLCNPIFQKGLQNRHPPRLKASQVVLPSFATSSKIRPDFSRNGFKIEVTKKYFNKISTLVLQWKKKKKDLDYF